MIVLIRAIFLIIALFLAYHIFRRVRSGNEKLSVGDLFQALAIVVSILIATFPSTLVQMMQAQEGEPTQTVLIPSLTSTPGGNYHLIYEETFEDQRANGIETIYGHFNIIQTSDGNHVWRTEDNATSQLILPSVSNDYAIEARIMQVSGNDPGQGTFWLRRKDGGPGCPAYLVYLIVLYDQVRLIEKDSDCNELQETGLYEDYYFEDSDGLSNGVWYTVRIEVKGAAVRVYWDGELILDDEDTDGDVRRSNVIGFAACCGNENTHTFDFDDIRAWVSDP